MRCSSYCTASSYDIPKLVTHLVENNYEPKYFDDVVHMQKEVNSDGKLVDIFYFPFGCMTLWNATEIEEKTILEEIQDFACDNIEQYSSDSIYYKIDTTLDETIIAEEQNQIILAEDSVFVKLAVSYALSQSVKLDVLEKSVANIIRQTEPLKNDLATKGHVSLSRKEIIRKIGLLFNERYSVNLHNDILDTPEFFWRRPSYEPLYLNTAAFQDIQVRQDILNRRLDMIHELYTILSNELEARHSSRLEWIIIILITIEVLLALAEHGMFQKLFSYLGM